MRQPVLFIPHGGGPCFYMKWDPPDTWDRHRAFLESLPAMLPERPRALLVISAHWEASRFTVQRHPAPPLVFDYYGFPPQTYELTWPAPGSIALADRVAGLLNAAGLACGFDATRGFDHGVFVPLARRKFHLSKPTESKSTRRRGCGRGLPANPRGAADGRRSAEIFRV